MAFRRKKQQEAPPPAREWDQTLTADEESPEPSSSDGSSEQEVATNEISTADGAPETPAPPVPDDVAQYVGTDGPNLVIHEYHFSPDLKRDVEDRVVARGQELEERWVPHERVPLGEIEQAVDGLAWKPRHKARGNAWLEKVERQRRDAILGMERVPPNILETRDVYETEGGFVIEVVYRELGEVLRKYFVVDGSRGRKSALKSVVSGTFHRTTMVSPAMIESLGRSGGRKAPAPPGKIRTFPIRNRTDVREVEGIGDAFTRRLSELGIQTTDQLRLTSAEVLAGHLGVTPHVVQKWQQMAEMMIVAGIGKQSAEVLARAGVTGIDALQQMNPKQLAGVVKAYVETLESGGTRVGPATARGWIRNARRLKKTLQAFPKAPDPA